MKVGDFVKEISHNRMGYIVKIRERELGENEVIVRMVRYTSGVEIFGTLTFYADVLEVLPDELHPEDLIELQHLAIQTNDKNWFEEIGKRRL